MVSPRRDTDKKDAEAKVAAARAKEEAAQRLKELDVHPLLKWKCDRNVRDAYFSGIVFAALANDLKIDDAERKVIDRIGASLQLAAEERDEMVASVQKTVHAAVRAGEENPSEANPFSLLEDCARSLKDRNVFRLFAAEYLKVCGAKALDAKDVREQLTEHVFSSSDVAFEPNLFKALCGCMGAGSEVRDEDLVVAADILGDDRLRYLVLDKLGDVRNRLTSMRKTRAAKARSKKEIARLERVRGAFEAELSKISNDYKEVASLPDGWDDDLRERMAQYEASDIDWVSSVNRRLDALRRIPRCYARFVMQHDTYLRRKLIWKLVGMYWVAVEELDQVHLKKIDDLLRSAKQLSTEGFNAKVESFIEEAFRGVVELT